MLVWLSLQVTVLVLVVTYAILKFRKASMDRDCQVRLQQALLCTVSGLQRLMNAYAWHRAGLQGHARGLPQDHEQQGVRDFQGAYAGDDMKSPLPCCCEADHLAPLGAFDFGPQDKDVKTSVDQYADLFTGVRKDVGKISSEVRLPYRFSCDASDRVEASRTGSSVSERPWWQKALAFPRLAGVVLTL